MLNDKGGTASGTMAANRRMYLSSNSRITMNGH